MKDDFRQIVFLALLLILLLSPIWWSPNFLTLIVAKKDLANDWGVAAIGSFFGAVGAAYIIERLGVRKEFITELRSCNAAITVTFHAYNSLAASQRQHVLPMVENYNELSKNHTVCLADNTKRFKFNPDVAVFNEIRVDLSILNSLLYEKVSPKPAILFANNELLYFLGLLNESIRHRNAILDRWREQQIDRKNPDLLIKLFLGLADKEGGDATYPHLVDAIGTYSKDCQFYAMFLCTQLMEHAKNLELKIGKKSSYSAIEISFTNPTNDEFRATDRYREFLSNFRNRK